MQRRPILSQSCAIATTAAESAFRIDLAADAMHRESRLVALDDGAARILERLEGRIAPGSRLFTYSGAMPTAGRIPEDAFLKVRDGAQRLLSEEVAEADVVFMVATGDAERQAAELVGDMCASYRVMSAAIVVGRQEVDSAVAALRPNAMVLVVLDNAHDIPDLLMALRV